MTPATRMPGMVRTTMKTMMPPTVSPMKTTKAPRAAKPTKGKNPMRFQDGIAIARTGADTYRITGGKNRKGDVGDIAVWSVKETKRPIRRAAVTSDACKGCTT